MRIAALLAALCALALSACGGHVDAGAEFAANAAAPLRARVTRAVDGDTIEVALSDGTTEDVRYIGVDTPETVDPGEPVGCFGQRASEFNARLVEGEDVRLVLRSRAPRPLRPPARLRLPRGRLVNAALVRGGFARTLAIPPNTDRAARFARLQARRRRGPGAVGRVLSGPATGRSCERHT